MSVDISALFASLPLADDENDETACEADDGAVPPVGSMVFRPALRKRNAVRYATVRAWRASTKKRDLADLKIAKHAHKISPDLVEFAARDIAGLVTALAGSALPCTVSVVATGHSRRPDAFARQIAEAVAGLLDRPFQAAFLDRYTSGVSHPKANTKLPPLELADPQIAGAVLLVDDIATSGWHMEEALTRLRDIGCPSFGVAWLGGSVSG